jgi:ABC-type multidrug transport system ATPase subunit
LLLDEPTLGLDRAAQERVLEALPALREGRCVVIATHAAEVIQRADRVLVLDRGRVVADGPALTAFVRDCLEAEPPLALGPRAAATVAAHRGATAATAERILALLPAGPRGTKGCPPAREPG